MADVITMSLASIFIFDSEAFNKFDLGRNIWRVKRLGYELIGEPYEVKVADDIR